MKFKLLLAGASLLCCGLITGNATAAPDIVVNYSTVSTSFQYHLSLSDDGRYTVYKTLIKMGPSGRYVTDIFIRDLVTGTDTQANLTVTGDLPNGALCEAPVISASGRYAVFACPSVPMGVVSKNGNSYFVYDRLNNKTEVIPDVGDVITNTAAAAISKDGRYIAFRTANKIFVRDMVSKSTTETSAKFVAASVSLHRMNISADGRYITYSGRVTSGIDALRHDRVTGTTEILNGVATTSTAPMNAPSTSADGMLTVFTAAMPALVSPPGPASVAVYLQNKLTGKVELIPNAGVGGVGTFATISGNGRYIAYTSGHAYVYDRVTKLTRRVVTSAATTGPFSAFSDDGRYFLFNAYSGSVQYFAIADLGVPAGVTLSATTLSLKEGGDAAMYSAALLQVPASDVNLNIGANNQLAFAREKLTFTAANWNVPQLISVHAVQDAAKQGKRTTNIVHTVSSIDPDYAAVEVANVAVTIDDGVAPTISVPGSPWTSSDMLVTGTAAPGATVILSAYNRTTGWMSGVSTVADGQGKWSYTLTGFTDGVVELDAVADGIKSAVQTVTVKLVVAPPTPTYIDVTGYIRTTGLSMAYNRATGKYVGNVLLTNTGSIPLSGPLHLQFDNLTAGITLSNATGSHNGSPYITVPGGLVPDGGVTIPLEFTNPAKNPINYDAKIYSGTF